MIFSRELDAQQKRSEMTEKREKWIYLSQWYQHIGRVTSNH